jgi:Fic family protein
MKDKYYKHLLDVSRRGDWLHWVRFFLKAVEVQSRDAIKRSDTLLALWNRYRHQLQEARASALLLSVIDELFSYPAISNRIASDALNVTPRSAQLNINKLISSGILEEVTGQRRNCVYVAREIVTIVEKSEARRNEPLSNVFSR